MQEDKKKEIIDVELGDILKDDSDFEFTIVKEISDDDKKETKENK